jgi:hypothetical protein
MSENDGGLLTTLKATANYICRASSDYYPADIRDTIIKALTYHINLMESADHPISESESGPERIRVIVRPGKDEWIGIAYSSSVEPNDVIREYVRPRTTAQH